MTADLTPPHGYDQLEEWIDDFYGAANTLAYTAGDGSRRFSPKEEWDPKERARWDHYIAIAKALSGLADDLEAEQKAEPPQ